MKDNCEGPSLNSPQTYFHLLIAQVSKQPINLSHSMNFKSRLDVERSIDVGL